MQATVWEFDAESRRGRVLLDDGVVLPFEAGALADTGLRLLRTGQRVRVETSGSGPVSVTRLQILTLPWVPPTPPT